MSRMSFILFSALLAASMGAPGPAQAAPAGQPMPGTKSMQVDLTAVDLTSAYGWHQALHRIDEASHSVCQNLVRDNWLMPLELAGCEEDARDNATEKLDELRLQQRQRSRAGHVILALSAGK